MSNESLNLWETILSESSKRSRLPEGTVIFMGSNSCEKEKLIEKFCVADANGGLGRAKTEILSYDFFYAVDPSDDGPVDEESVTRVSLWSLNEQAFRGALEVVLDPSKIERLVIMIGIDLSKPEECSHNLRKWLCKAKQEIDNYFSKLSSENVETLLQTNNKFLNIHQNNTNNTNETDTSTSNINPESTGNTPLEKEKEREREREKEFINYGIPIIVIGCNTEFLQMEDATAMKRLKDVQGEIRSICLQVGAGLLYISTEKESDVTRLHTYLLHRLYPEIFNSQLRIEDGIKEVCIPAGLDTTDLIHISTGVPAEEIRGLVLDLEGDVDTVIESSETVSVSSNTGEVVELEDEQSWLAMLHSYIDQVTAASGTTTALKSTASTADLKTTAAAEGRSTPRANLQTDHSNIPTEELKNFFTNLLK